jgi:hypothetical protein
MGRSGLPPPDRILYEPNTDGIIEAKNLPLKEEREKGGDHATVGIRHTRHAAIVGPAGHLDVGVLHLGRAPRVHCPGLRLIFGNELPQSIEHILHLVDDIATRGRIIAGEEM